MQFRDLKLQYQILKEDIDKQVLQVMNDCNFINGQQVKEFEKDLADFVGVKYCIGCANGTDALSLCLMAYDIKQGDAVFVPDFTFFSTGEVVSSIGATPIFVDVSKETYNMSTKSLQKAIQEVKKEGVLSPKAIIPVDLFGLPYDVEKINKIAKDNNLLVIEDGAQGFGGEFKGKKACSFGDIATTSFFPAKPLGCYGDGGAIFTNDEKIKDLINSYKVHGKGTFKYDNVRIGINSRLDTMQAAVLKVKFKAFKEYELTDINIVANKYIEKLNGYVTTPMIEKNYLSSWAQFTIQLKSKEQREFVQQELKKLDIPTMIYYPKPMHNQQAFSELKIYQENKNTISLCDTVLALPIHPYLKDVDIDYVVDNLINLIK